MTQKQIFRCGSCANCGDCCILFVNFNYQRCRFYNLYSEKHCTIYDTRPEICRNFPAVPMAVQDKPNCGYRFLDEKGRKVDGFEDARTRLSLIHAIKKLKKKGII